MVDMDEFFSNMKACNVKEAAEILNKSEQSIRGLIRKKELQAVKVGRTFMIPKNEINRLVLGEDAGSSYHHREEAYLDKIKTLELKNRNYEKIFEMLKEVIRIMEIEKNEDY